MVAVAHAGTHHYYYTDPQGTVLAKADASGTIIATYDYAPYGTAVASMSPAPNGPGYTGHLSDPDTGLVYMQARYYDPSMGRFLGVDPVEPATGNPFNFNRYAYASNNPIVNVDPDGRNDIPFGDCSKNPNCQTDIGSSATDDSRKNNGSCGNDDLCQIRADYYQSTTSKSNEVVSTAKQIAAGLSTVMEEGYTWFAFEGLGKLGTVAKEVEGLGIGYRSFGIFKRRMGSAGAGMEWHHIVEQTSDNIAKFGSYAIHSEGNLVRLDKATHARISAIYSSKTEFSGGLTVREWLQTKDFSEQMSFGKQILWRNGVNVPE
jgi:RHS repeat-associated protein